MGVPLELFNGYAELLACTAIAEGVIEFAIRQNRYGFDRYDARGCPRGRVARIEKPVADCDKILRYEVLMHGGQQDQNFPYATRVGYTHNGQAAHSVGGGNIKNSAQCFLCSFVRYQIIVYLAESGFSAADNQQAIGI